MTTLKGPTPLFFTLCVHAAVGESIAVAQDTSPLTIENHSLLCVKTNNDQAYVETDRLYSILLAQAQIPGILLDKATQRGTSREQAALQEEFPQDSLLPGAEETLKTMRERKNLLVQNFAGEVYSTSYKKQGYIREDRPDLPEVFVFDIFDDGVTFAIRCIEPTSRSDTVKIINEFVFRTLGNFRLRKNIDELTLVAAAPTAGSIKERLEGLRSAQLAALSLAREYEKDTTSVAVEGAIGYQIERWLPFFSAQFQNRNGTKQDIEVIAPGLAYDRVFPSTVGDPRVVTKLFLPLDLQNDGERAALAVSAEPAFSIGSNITLGNYTTPIGDQLWVRPSVAPLVEASHVFDAGTNREFQKAKDFVGVGIISGVKFKMPEIPLLESATLSVDYRWLQMVAGDTSAFDMFRVSLDWTPKDIPYFGVSVSYNVGENSLTFQDEKGVNVSIGARF